MKQKPVSLENAFKNQKIGTAGLVIGILLISDKFDAVIA
jgi:hypothetical protein